MIDWVLDISCFASFIFSVVFLIDYLIKLYKRKKANPQAENDIQSRKEELLTKLNKLHKEYLATAGQTGRLEQFRKDILQEISRADLKHVYHGYMEIFNLTIRLEFATSKYEIEEILKKIIVLLEKDLIIGPGDWDKFTILND